MERDLFLACTDGAHAEVAALLAKGANPNYVISDLTSDNFKETPLIAASSFGHAKCVEALLAGGAKPGLRSVEGWAALHWCAYSGNVEVAQLLLGAAADKGVKDESGATALDTARKYKRGAMVALLLGEDQEAAAAAPGSGEGGAAAAGTSFAFTLLEAGAEGDSAPFERHAPEVAEALRRWGLGPAGLTPANGGNDCPSVFARSFAFTGRLESSQASLDALVTSLFRTPALLASLPQPVTSRGQTSAVAWRPVRTKCLHLSLLHRLADAGIEPAAFREWLVDQGGALGPGGGAPPRSHMVTAPAGELNLDDAFLPQEQDELMFRVFKALCLGGRGGSVDASAPGESGWRAYVAATGAVMRKLVRVGRVPRAQHPPTSGTGDAPSAVAVTSIVLEVVDVEGDWKLYGSAFSGGDTMSAHSYCYVVIDPHSDPDKQKVTVWHHALSNDERWSAPG